MGVAGQAVEEDGGRCALVGPVQVVETQIVQDDELFVGVWLTGYGPRRRPWGEALYSLASGGQKESAQTGAFRQRHAWFYSRSLP